VSSVDVEELQGRVATYRVQLLTAIEAIRKSGRTMDDAGPHTEAAWDVVQLRALHWVSEEPAIVFVETQYDRGRHVLAELDEWRDYFATLVKVPGIPLPLPMPVPPSELSTTGAIGWGLIALVAVLIAHEFK
jgi:hypothetical protein